APATRYVTGAPNPLPRVIMTPMPVTTVSGALYAKTVKTISNIPNCPESLVEPLPPVVSPNAGIAAPSLLSINVFTPTPAFRSNVVHLCPSTAIAQLRSLPEQGQDAIRRRPPLSNSASRH